MLFMTEQNKLYIFCIQKTCSAWQSKIMRSQNWAMEDRTLRSILVSNWSKRHGTICYGVRPKTMSAFPWF